MSDSEYKFCVNPLVAASCAAIIYSHVYHSLRKVIRPLRLAVYSNNEPFESCTHKYTMDMCALFRHYTSTSYLSFQSLNLVQRETSILDLEDRVGYAESYIRRYAVSMCTLAERGVQTVLKPVLLPLL